MINLSDEKIINNYIQSLLNAGINVPVEVLCAINRLLAKDIKNKLKTGI